MDDVDDVYSVQQYAPDEYAPHGRWRWSEPVGYVFPPRWCQAFQGSRLSRRDMDVFYGLLAHCGWNNQLLCTYRFLAQELGMHRSAVSRAMKHLVAQHLCCVEYHVSRKIQTVTLSPWLLWKGRPWHVHRAREQFDATWRLAHGQAGRGEPPPGESLARLPAPSPEHPLLAGLISHIRTPFLQ